MPTELERQLEGFLDAAPEPRSEVGEEALRRVLAVLDARRTRPRSWAVGLGLAATIALLAVAAGALAAAGALHVSLGKPKAPHTLTLPAGAHGIAVVVDGRLSVVTKSGFRLQGLRVSAAALSPHALYVAVGIGSSLVALAPNGHRAWSHPAGGTVTAIAWAPDGLRIAYVVRHTVHVIWGNGTHDTVLDSSVRSVQPAWRADSLAFAYVGAGGQAVVYDLGHRSREVVARSASIAPVTQLAFSPDGAQLAAAGNHASLLPASRAARLAGDVAGIGWLGDGVVVAETGNHGTLRLDPPSNDIPPQELGGRVVGFETDGYRYVAAARRGEGLAVLSGIWGKRPQTVLELPQNASVRDLALVR